MIAIALKVISELQRFWNQFLMKKVLPYGRQLMTCTKTQMARTILQKGISVRETEQLVKRLAEPKIKTSKIKDPEVLSIEEQKEIVKIVKSYFTLLDSIVIKFLRTNKRVLDLPHSILAKAFRGELVEQEANKKQ